ncbi:MAG: roadblock/LC7 domain-containing protein [Candidatus Thorarchaeota archaeon]
MSGLGLSESEKMEKLSHELSNLKSQGNLSGILFSERSGKLIKALYDNEFDFEEFSSMCASVLESALELGRAMGDKKVKKIITELEQKIIILLECDRKTFLCRSGGLRIRAAGRRGDDGGQSRGCSGDRCPRL